MIKDAVRYLLIRLRGVSFDWIKLMKSVSSCDGADLQLLSTLGTNEIWAFESTFFILVNRRDQVKGLNTYKMITLFMKWPSDVSVEICWTLPVNNFSFVAGLMCGGAPRIRMRCCRATRLICSICSVPRCLRLCSNLSIVSLTDAR